jgi:hypothetical protein
MRLNQMALQPGQGLLAFRQRQPQRFRRMVDRAAAADADFMASTVPPALTSSTTTRHFIPLVPRDQADPIL